jgi:hypothetical protein
MIDLHITLAWIMADLPARARQYVLHGLGEEKLLVEQYKAEIAAHPPDGGDEHIPEIVKIKEQWINSQRRELFVEVDLGHWARLDARRMAQESGNDGLYKFAYRPFSHAAHNMWPHVSIYNARTCKNALHRYHLVPELFEAPLDLDFLYRACKYMHKTYKLFVDKFSIKLDAPLPVDWWYQYFSKASPGPESSTPAPAS